MLIGYLVSIVVSIGAKKYQNLDKSRNEMKRSRKDKQKRVKQLPKQKAKWMSRNPGKHKMRYR
jgi:hypothetical protein